LHWASEEPSIGAALFLDTTVYIDVLQDRSPKEVDDLLWGRACHHSAVCLAELTHLFGRLDPAHPETSKVLRAVRQTIEDIPEHRLHAPEIAIWAQAGMLAGEIARLTGLSKREGNGRRFFNDALICLQAQRLGANVLTSNIRDYDFLNPLLPRVRTIFYRRQSPRDGAD
jgi:predicted nucleic acid-binding protein